MVLNAINEERKEQKARAMLRNWGCEITDYNQYQQRYKEQFVNDLVLVLLNNMLYAVLGFVLALILVAKALTVLALS